MASNKIVIGKGKDKDKNEFKPDLLLEKPDIINSATDQTPQEIPLDENVWGNDNKVLNKLNDQQLAERRLFVRIIFMRAIKCYEIYENIEADATKLAESIDFSITDISVGGIGIISDCEIPIGTILCFKLVLDEKVYDIKCEVIYCFSNDNKFRAGLKVIHKDKEFIKHLKIVIARVSLRNQYS